LNKSKIPAATISRLSIYHRYLKGLVEKGTSMVSSNELAKQTNVNPAQLRKDLSYFGRFGIRGVGYNVSKLSQQIKKILGLEKTWNLALVGTDCIGQALLEHQQFKKNGYNFVAVFDVRKDNVGKSIGDNLVIHPLEKLPSICRNNDIDLGVIAVRPEEAQEVADRMIDAGIFGILCFSTNRLKIPPNIAIQYVDFTALLDTLTYNISKPENCVPENAPPNLPSEQDEDHSWPAIRLRYNATKAAAHIK